MLKVFNKQALTKNQRFNNALLYGIPTSLVLAIAYGLVTSLIKIEFSAIYLAFGYGIGMIIQKKGRGVQPKFSILAAILAVICFIIGDMIAIAGSIAVLWTPALWGPVFNIVFTMYTSISIGSVLSLLFRVGGVYYAYLNARVV